MKLDLPTANRQVLVDMIEIRRREKYYTEKFPWLSQAFVSALVRAEARRGSCYGSANEVDTGHLSRLTEKVNTKEVTARYAADLLDFLDAVSFQSLAVDFVHPLTFYKVPIS
jgi:hypothetical protein